MGGSSKPSEGRCDVYPREDGGLFARIKTVADPWLGKNVFWIGRIGFELFAQLADEDPELFSLFSVIAAPDCAQQLVMGEHRARMLNHKQ
jgi:hypothetical protein